MGIIILCLNAMREGMEEGLRNEGHLSISRIRSEEGASRMSGGRENGNRGRENRGSNEVI